MEWKDHLVTDPEIGGGRPCVRGTRLTVEFLLGLKEAGWSETQILENYPHLTDGDLRAVFAFAHQLIKEEKYLVLPDVD